MQYLVMVEDTRTFDESHQARNAFAGPPEAKENPINDPVTAMGLLTLVGLGFRWTATA